MKLSETFVRTVDDNTRLKPYGHSEQCI